MTNPPTFVARRVLRNRWLLALAASPLLLYVPLLVSLLFGFAGQLPLLLHPLLLAGVAMFEVARRNPRPRLVEGEVGIDERTVTLPDGTLLARNTIEQGFVTSTGSGARVTLFGPRIPIELELDSEKQGHALLAALGLDAGHTAVSFSGQSRVATLPQAARALGLVAAWLPALLLITFGVVRASFDRGLGSPGMLSLMAGAIMMFAPLGPLALLARPARITVGVDGVEILWFGRRRFVPFGRVEAVELLKPEIGTKVSRGVTLLLDDGERVALPLSKSSLVEGEVERLQARIEQARAARGARRNAGARLHRAVEEGSELITALRRAGAGAAAGPREAAIDQDALFATLEDASEPAAARAQAAIVLCSAGDAESRERTLKAARQVASPRLRIALERAAEEDIEEAALIEAMTAVAEEEQASLPRRR
jgi:hypothetical protein